MPITKRWSNCKHTLLMSTTVVPYLPVSHLHKFKWLLNILYTTHAHKDGTTSDFLWTNEGIFMTGLSHGEKKTKWQMEGKE